MHKTSLPIKTVILPLAILSKRSKYNLNEMMVPSRAHLHAKSAL